MQASPLPRDLAAAARERAIDEVIAKQQIYDVLCRYCHGIDRCDAELLKTAYWPDAYEEHGTFDGPAQLFAEEMTVGMRQAFLRSTQMIGNALIEVDGDRARGETYVVAYMQAEVDGAVIDRTIGGRYLDRFERRDGEWRILRRLYVLDWNRNGPSTAEADGLYAMLKVRGARSPDDPWDRNLPRHQGAGTVSQA